MMKRAWMAVVVVLLVLGWSACTTSDGECWLKNEDGAGPGAGGGPIVPSQGGYGDVPPGPQGVGGTSETASAASSPCDADESPAELVDVRCPAAKRGVTCMMYCADNGHFCPAGMNHKVTKELGYLYRCCGCSGDEQCWYAYSNDGVCVPRPELPPGKNLMCK